MRIIRDTLFIDPNDRGAAAAIGNFDGVHIGHQSVIDLTRQAAKAANAPLGVMTFEPHPRAYFSRDPKPFRLMNAEARANRLALQGQPIPRVLPGFDPELPGRHEYDLERAREEMRLAGHPDGIEQEIERALERKVSLPSGGSLVFDQGEALTAIDVNTGRYVGKRNLEETIARTNLEAAQEVVHQLRLRNIGGIIIIDFIDMKQRRHRNAILSRMRDAMAPDKAKTHILPISPLGIMQMTRQRMQESVSSGLYTDCPYCRGKGIVKSGTTVSVELQRKLSGIIRRARARMPDLEKPIKLRILVNPSIIDRLREEDADLLISLEKDYNAQLTFRADPNFHVENYRVIDVETGAAYG